MAGIGIFLLSPLILCAGLLVLLFDGRPVFFRQIRVGRDGRYFHLIKFRTMTLAAEADKGRFDAGDQSRVTPLGKILRKFKLDELPQLGNVLRGDMSLVGPRPEVPRWVSVYPQKWQYVLKVRPGITDNSSIEFRNEEDLLAQAEDPEAFYRNVILPRKLDFYSRYVTDFGGCGLCHPNDQNRGYPFSY